MAMGGISGKSPGGTMKRNSPCRFYDAVSACRPRHPAGFPAGKYPG
jgi:hypothetical protein